ncbi:MAG: P-II family nitrogen regulator [Flavobacteriaceae bacterium]
MKEIKAFIRPDKLNKVAQNLKENKFCCFTVFEGEGVGNYADPEKEYPSLKFPYLHAKVVKLEIVCKKENVDNILTVIRTFAHTGESGDGIIYVMDVEQKIKIKHSL